MKTINYIKYIAVALLVALTACNDDDKMGNRGSAPEINGVYYRFDNATKTAEVTYKGMYAVENEEYQGAVIVPNQVTYNGVTYKVIAVGEYAFSENKNLTSVTLADGITEIKNGAFNNCSSLKTVDIKATSDFKVDFVSSFINCNELDNISFSGNATYATENGVILNAAKTKICFYPKGLTAETYTLPSTVTEVGNYAFSKCKNLKTVNFNAGMTIGTGAFSQCTSLKTLTIDPSAFKIGEMAFMNCTSLEELTITNTRFFFIEKDAFYGCSSLKKITFAGSLKQCSFNIGAFKKCTALEELTIPIAKKTTFYEKSFEGCSMLTITFTGKLSDLKSTDYLNNEYLGCYKVINSLME